MQQQEPHMVLSLNTCLELITKSAFLKTDKDCSKIFTRRKNWNYNIFFLTTEGSSNSHVVLPIGFQGSLMYSLPTWHGVDQVPTKHHKPRPGLELVNSLHSLLGEFNLLGPFVPSAVAVALPPNLHQPKLGVCSLDEAKWPRPLTLCIRYKKREKWTS